jgi:hypothetical protein
MRTFAAFPAAALFLKGILLQLCHQCGTGLAMLVEKLPPLGSGAPQIPLVGASGSVVGPQFIPLRSTPRRLISWSGSVASKPTKSMIGGLSPLLSAGCCASAWPLCCVKPLPGAEFSVTCHRHAAEIGASFVYG